MLPINRRGGQYCLYFMYVTSLVPRLVRGRGEKSLVHNCLHMLSFPRISGNLETPVKSAPLH